MNKVCSTLSFVFIICCSLCQGDNFRFANNYGSNMVLQRAPQRAVLWGFGEANQLVQIHINASNHIVVETIVKKDLQGYNTWKIVLNPVEKFGPYKITATSKWQNKSVSAILDNVLFGDVWVCSGQSNMQFTVGMSSTAKEEIDLANNRSYIRLFTMKRYISKEPVFDLDPSNIIQNWTVATNVSVHGENWSYFSALCWMYGRRLYDLYKVPIGLLATSFGGTCAEAWSPQEALNKCGIDQNSVVENQQYLRFRKKRQTQVRKTKTKEIYGDLASDFLDVYDKDDDPNQYKVLWNAMIVPHLNTTIKGVIWYQGERNNLINPDLYACVFPEMINSWRKIWHEGTEGNTDPTFPFGFVQLASIGQDFVAQRPLFPKIRWEQTANYGYVPNSRQQNVFMAVAMDLPDDQSPYRSIHPRDKATVADRLILGARSHVYGEAVNYQGPILDSCDIIKHDGVFVARIQYKGFGKQGITVKSPNGFEAMITGSTEWLPIQIISLTEAKNGVILSIPTKDISVIRYAWNHRPCDYKKCAIYSVENDLPSPPSICYIP